MVVFRGLDDRRLLPRPAAVAVGNFDGLHLGHRRILAHLCRLARRRGLRSLVLTFEPHPERALGKRSVRMIDTPDQRLARLGGTCVDAVVVIPFDRAFAGLGCPAFVEGVLRDKLGAREVVVGRGFRFGRDRRGDVALLRRLGREAGLGVHVVAPAVLGGRTVSSTAVRSLLAAGPGRGGGPAARASLRDHRQGRPGRSSAAASSATRRPTSIPRTRSCPRASSSARPSARGTAHPSVTSIGTNPTFGPNPLTVETLLLDYRGSLYGAEITVRLLRRLRPPRAFPGAEALAARHPPGHRRRPGPGSPGRG